MAISFPQNPTIGDTYVVGDNTFVFDGALWTLGATAGTTFNVQLNTSITNTVDLRLRQAAKAEVEMVLDRTTPTAKVRPLTQAKLTQAVVVAEVDKQVVIRSVTVETVAPA